MSSTGAPLSGTAMTMRIEEPRGFLRSWDLRADLWSDQPRCTAIVTRPLQDSADFPAWFVNITDQMLGTRAFTMRVSGVVASQPFAQTIDVTGESMRFDPTIDGESLWHRGLVTVGEPRAIDRLLAPWAWLVSPLLCLALIAGLAIGGDRSLAGGRGGVDVGRRSNPRRGAPGAVAEQRCGKGSGRDRALARCSSL